MGIKTDLIQMEVDLARQDFNHLVVYVEAAYNQMTVEEINQEWMDAMVDWDWRREAQGRYEYAEA